MVCRVLVLFRFWDLGLGLGICHLGSPLTFAESIVAWDSFRVWDFEYGVCMLLLVSPLTFGLYDLFFGTVLLLIYL